MPSDDPIEWRAYVSAATHPVRLAIAYWLAVSPNENTYDDLVSAVSDYYSNVREWEPLKNEDLVKDHLRRNMIGRWVVKEGERYFLKMPDISIKYIKLLYPSKDDHDFWKFLNELEEEIGYESPKLGLMK